MANNIVKTPYEISVWEDKLYYQKITTWFEAAGSQQEGTQYYEATHAAAEYDPDARYYKLENGRYIYTVPPASTSTYVNYYLISPATSSTQTFLALQHAEEEYDIDSTEPLNDDEQVISSFVEVPLAVIGSDTMDTPIRAHQPHLNCNINGTKTLTFLMYYRYYDYDVGDYVENPFIKLMVNERKIKLHYKNEWYDFIIKNIEESTDSTSITYVCQDQFITELGKTGFQLEFDTDLSNNTGTIEELGAAILDGTDWKLGDSDLLPQRTQEPLYVLSIASGTTLQCKYTRFENNEAVDYNATISGPTVIYAYYTPIIDQNPRVQFLYLPSGIEPKINDGILENSEQYYIDGVTYNASGIPNFAVNTVLTPAEFQGKRLVRSYETLYDPKSQHTVSIYDKDESGDPAVLYEYESYQYKAPVILENRLANTTLFENTSGWQSYGTNEMSIVSDPPVTESIDPDAKIYLSYTINDNTALRNDGLFAKPFTPGIMEGTTYVLRIKTPQRNTNLTARIVDYTDTQDSSTHLITPNFGATTYLSFDSALHRQVSGAGRYYLTFNGESIYLPQDDEDDDTFYIATATNTLSYSEMRAKVAAFFLEGSVNTTYLIQGIELYEYLTEEVEDENHQHYNTLMTPSTQELKGKVTTIYNYYDPAAQPEIVSDPAEIKYYYSDTTLLSGYTQRYRANYEKVRSITARESNRLNLIQSCCETFECWADFRIAHNESDGRLITELLPYIDVDGYVKYRVRADKTVTFKEFIGTDNYRGFRYGINLNSISRTIDSDAIVTKMIVSMNSNEHAENGFCTIARAPSNLTGEDFLISFDYYIHQGLLNGTQVYNDLYTKGPITMGYYSGLADINKSNKPLIEEQNDLVSRVIPRAQADLTMYTEARSAAANSKQEWVTLIEGKGCTREQYEDIVAIPPQSRTANERRTIEWAKSYYIKIITFEKQFDYYNTLAEAAEARYNEYTARLDEIQDLLDKNVIRKQELNQDFYTKYSRFIQEGSWIDEDYVEDELYYLDALSVLTTSNQPEVNYNINVLELSELEGYENYTYKLGDKSYIEDTELFGYVTISGLRTPYQEEIIISETDDYFDEPENNTFKVQNYKTQFEDLFQRIAAETTNIQYASGSYNRAASVVNTDGTFNAAALQSTLNDSSLILSNLRDQSVVWDENGITITSDAYPLQIVRLVSRGIVLSNDGGQTWTVGISGSGINTAALSAGAIDTSLIVLRSGEDPSFRWDSYGITAYDFDSPEETNTFNWNKFVRYDRFGIYAYDGPLLDTEYHPTEESDITENENVKFSLTWSGFRLRTDNGAVNITSDNDIQVFGPNAAGTDIIERIKIGELSNNVYGLRISDDTGAAVMETNSDGDLWLKKRLNISSTSDNYNIGVGYLDAYKTVDNTQVHEVFNANDLFIVYEDGSVQATNGTFEGYINATGGQIGNLTINYDGQNHGTIADLVAGTPGFRIESVNGFIFTQQDGTVSPTELNINAAGLSSTDLAHTTWEVWDGPARTSPNHKVWQYSTGSGQAASIVLPFSELTTSFSNSNILYLFAICGSHVVSQSLNYITATAEVDQYQVVITSSAGTDISARGIQTALTVQVFLNGVECTADYDNFTYVWTRDSGDINEDTVYNYQLSGSSTRTLLAFNSVNAIYYCKVYLQDELLNIGEISLVSQADEDELYLSLSQDEVLIYYDENKQLTTSPNIITLVMQRYGDLTDNLTMASMQIQAAGQSIKRWINPKINVQYLVNNNPNKTYVDVYEYLHALGDIGGYTVTDEDLSGFAPGVTYYTYDYDDITGYGYTPVTSEYNAAQVYYTNQGDVEFLKWVIIDGDFTPTADQSPISGKPYFTIKREKIDFSGNPPTWETSRTITVGTQNVQLPIKYYRRYRLNGEYVDSRDITGSFYDAGSAATNFFIPDNGSLTLGETGGYLQVLSIVGNVTGSEYTASTTPQPGVSFTINGWTAQTQDTGVFVTYFDYYYYKDVEEQASTYTNFPANYYDIIFQAKSIDFFVKQLFEFMPNHIEEVYSNPNWVPTSGNLTSWSDIFKTFEQLKFHGIYVPADSSLNPTFASGKTYYLAGRDGTFKKVTDVDGANAIPYSDKVYYINDGSNWVLDELDWPNGDTNEYYYYSTRDKAFIKAGAKRIRTMQYYTFYSLPLESLTFLLELFNPEGDPYNIVNNNIQVAPKGTTDIPIRYGLNSDALEFQINAYNISAAIQNSKLLFDADGLHVYNGGFDIYNNAGDRVLYADTYGNLTLAGTIEATAGNIGGFTITDTTLTKDNLFVLDTNNLMLRLGNVGTGIIIDSNFDNNLYTSSLSIGQNLILTSKSSPTNSAISTYPIFDFAPNGVSTLVLNSDGSVEGRNWSVNANGHANFNDATISGTVTGSTIIGSTIEGNNILGGVISGAEVDGGVINAGVLNAVEINSATFNTQEVRSMGGTFIFRPTAKPIGYSVTRPISYNTLTGSVISVDDDFGDLAITSLSADIEPQQDLNGYDNPWPAGGGANKLDPTEVTVFGSAYGFTLVWNANDGSLNINGTYTGSGSTVEFRAINVPSAVRSLNVKGFSSSSNFSSVRWQSGDNQIVVKLTKLAQNSSYNITIYPIVYEGSTAPASWTPYSNICPITGHTEVNVTRTGKNLLPQTNYNTARFTVASDGNVSQNNPSSATFSWSYSNGIMRATLPAGTYTATETVTTACTASGHGVQIYDDSDVRVVAVSGGVKAVGEYSASFTLTKTTNIALVCKLYYGVAKFSIVAGSTAQSYEPYQGTTFTIDWTTEAGTVYGGTIDVATGLLTVDRVINTRLLNTFNLVETRTNTKHYRYIGNFFGVGTGRVENNSSAICNIATQAYNSTDTIHFYMVWNTGNSQNRVELWLPTETPTDTSVQISAKLLAPQTYQLTPQQISTILGTNHIWANIGNIKINTNNSAQTITFDLPDDSFVNVSEIDDILRVNNYYGIITAINESPPSVEVTFNTTARLNLDSITSFLNLGPESITPIISISSEGYTADGLIAGSGLSMTNVTLKDNFQPPQVVSHLFLGDFSKFKDILIHPELPQSGYGLVADNVFLRGSLTTQQDTSYSGINTVSEILFNHSEIQDPDPTTDHIIFWGGAEGTSDSQIQAAPFQVSSHGNFYASSGLFRGSIISDATITGATLEAAVIKGGDTAALKIYDTGVAGGIQFMEKVGSIDGSGIVGDSTDIITLGIASTGLYTGQQDSIEYFIKVNPVSHTAAYNGIFNSPNDINNHVQVDNTGIAYYVTNEGNPELKTTLILNESNIQMWRSNSQYIMVDSNSNILANNVNQFNNEIIYQTVVTDGNNDTVYRLNYKRNNSDNYGGYNLIVT